MLQVCVCACVGIQKNSFELWYKKNELKFLFSQLSVSPAYIIIKYYYLYQNNISKTMFLVRTVGIICYLYFVQDMSLYTFAYIAYLYNNNILLFMYVRKNLNLSG